MSETKLLYRAIRELAYIQETGHECISNKRADLVITSEGAAIVTEGMALLGLKDLAADELPDAAAVDEMAKALEPLLETHCCDTGEVDYVTEWDGDHTVCAVCRPARAALAAYNALK